MSKQGVLPIPGFEQAPEGKLLTQFVDFNDPFGVAYERCIGYSKDFHVHDRVNLTFPRASAHLIFSTRHPKKQFLVDAHSFLWMPSFVEHSQDTRSLVYDNFAVFPNDEILAGILRDFRLRYEIDGELPRETLKKTRSVLLQELVNEYFADRILARKSPHKMIHLSHQIIEETLRIVLGQKRTSDFHDNSKELIVIEEEDIQIARTVRLIEANLFEKLSVNQIAEHSGLSVATLFRRFHKQLGMTPGEYATRRRLDESLSLLKSGSYSVSDIALIVGYSDLAAFSKAFKKHFGKAPHFYCP